MKFLLDITTKIDRINDDRAIVVKTNSKESFYNKTAIAVLEAFSIPLKFQANFFLVTAEM